MLRPILGGLLLLGMVGITGAQTVPAPSPSVPSLLELDQKLMEIRQQLLYLQSVRPSLEQRQAECRHLAAPPPLLTKLCQDVDALLERLSTWEKKVCEKGLVECEGIAKQSPLLPRP